MEISEIIVMNSIIRHKLTRSEVNYGRLFLREDDDSFEFFSKLPSEFNMNVNGRLLYNKHVNTKLKKISIGDDIMSQFKEHDIITIRWDGNIVTIE